MPHTHTLAHAGTEQPLSCASESPDGPSVSPLCPAGRRASGAHRSLAQLSTSSLAGARRTASPVEDQTHTLSLVLLLCRHTSSKKKRGGGGSVNPLDQETSLMLRTSRRASKTVTHFAVNPHLSQCLIGRGLSFVTSKRTVMKRRRDSTEEKTVFWGNCQSEKKPET